MAVSWGTPTPATMRVVHIDPGPMPTFTASAPASISALVPSAVATLPAITCTRLDCFLMRVTASSTRLEWPCAVSTTTRSTPASISRSVRCEAVIAHTGRRRHAQPAVLVLGSVRVLLGLLDVLDRNEADAAKGLIHHQQLFDPMLVQQSLSVIAADAFLYGNELLGHQLGDRRRRVGGEAHVAVGEDAEQLPFLPASTTGMPEMWCSPIRRRASASVALG